MRRIVTSCRIVSANGQVGHPTHFLPLTFFLMSKVLYNIHRQRTSYDWRHVKVILKFLDKIFAVILLF